MLLPNISLEYDLRRYNWNRHTLGVGVRYNWQTKHSYKPALVYNFFEFRGEYKYYWRIRKIINDTTGSVTSVMPARNFLQRLFSTNRDTLRHPNTTYYRGLFVSYSKYSVMLNSTGRQGTGLTAGVLYGIVKPLYQFRNGNSLDLDLGVSIGFCFTKFDKYKLDRESDCYPVTERTGWHLNPYPMLTEARLAFIYRFGKYPLVKKYRWRYDVDAAYMEKMDRRNEEQSKVRKEKIGMDELRKRFEKLRDQFMPAALKAAQEDATAEEMKRKRLEEERKYAKEEAGIKARKTGKEGDHE